MLFVRQGNGFLSNAGMYVTPRTVTHQSLLMRHATVLGVVQLAFFENRIAPWLVSRRGSSKGWGLTLIGAVSNESPDHGPEAEGEKGIAVGVIYFGYYCREVRSHTF